MIKNVKEVLGNTVINKKMKKNQIALSKTTNLWYKERNCKTLTNFINVRCKNQTKNGGKERSLGKKWLCKTTLEQDEKYNHERNKEEKKKRESNFLCLMAYQPSWII